MGIVRKVRWGLLELLRVRPSPEVLVGPRVQIFDGLMLTWASACAVLGWLRLHLAHVAWIGLMLVFPLTTGGNQLSLGRYLLAAWPAFFLMGWLLRWQPVVAAVVMTVSLAAMFLFSRDHALGRFVG